MNKIIFTKNTIVSKENDINITVDNIDNKTLFKLLSVCVKNEDDLDLKLKEDATPSCQKIYEYIKEEFTEDNEL